MTPCKGPRPWSIHLFAAIFTGLGLFELTRGLTNLDTQMTQFSMMIPWLDWDKDWTIVALSARFTIVLIPVVAVWGYANPLARLLVTLVAILGVPGLLLQVHALSTDGSTAVAPLVTTAIMYAAIATLFMPSAGRWFRLKGESEAAVFS